MPLLNMMDFAESHLAVRFRASIEPQEVDIYVKTAGRSQERNAGADMAVLASQVRYGVAGGSRFEPARGLWERLSGVAAPDKGPEAFGPEYRWKCRVAAIDPLFLRSVAEGLRSCGWAPDNPVEEMSIVGQLPLDDSDLSVTETQVRAWLDDPTAYVGEWPNPGFPIDHKEATGTGVALRVKLQRAATSEELDWLNGCAHAWVNTLSNYVSEDGKQIRFEFGLLPRVSRSKLGLSAHYKEFRWTRGPARAVIINTLARYHVTYAPIERVELRL